MLWKSAAVGCVLVGQRVGGWAPPPPPPRQPPLFLSLHSSLSSSSVCPSVCPPRVLPFLILIGRSGRRLGPMNPHHFLLALGRPTDVNHNKWSGSVGKGGALKNVLLLQCKMEDNDLMGRWIRTRPTTITHICNSINGWRQETQVVRKPCLEKSSITSGCFLI